MALTVILSAGKNSCLAISGNFNPAHFKGCANRRLNKRHDTNSAQFAISFRLFPALGKALPIHNFSNTSKRFRITADIISESHCRRERHCILGY